MHSTRATVPPVRPERSRRAAAAKSRGAHLIAAVLLAACGDTLVDHRNVAIQEGPGGSVCGGADISCEVNGAFTCVPEDDRHCGACVDCTAGFVLPHPSAVPACDVAARGEGVCGYACTGGLIKCPDGCCTAQKIAAGGSHSCAVTSDGGLSCWGANAAGQVTGSPSAAPVTGPARRFDAGVVAVAAGEQHTCAAFASEVRCWGRNLEGQAPASVSLAGVTTLVAGLTHTCALAGSTVTCWGRGQGAATVAGATAATALAAGADHTCALVGGAVVCWGANGAGQLGNASQVASPTPVQAISSGITAIAAGGDHTCAATGASNGSGLDDALRCWGDQPGPSFLLSATQTSPAIPRKDASTSVVRFEVTRLATGRSHVCVQKAPAETVRCFGAEASLGQLGGTPAPTALTELVDVGATLGGSAAFAAGADHACAILAGGAVRCWGSNASGQLGDGSTVTPGVGGDPRPIGTGVSVSGR